MPGRPRKNAAHAGWPLVALCLTLSLVASGSVQDHPDAKQLEPVRQYIKATWKTLTRSTKDLPAAARDPKLPHKSGEPWAVYVSPKQDRSALEKDLRRVLSKQELAQLDIRTLPADTRAMRDHGLLYLPYPYVVPGGRFNEMYGWDSYFIQVGLLHDGETERALDMVRNFLYEIEHYGMILNANRTYYLTRSQPPFLTRMIRGVFGRTKDREWLRTTLPAIDRYYAFWTTAPHLIPEIGLSRYFDLGEGPAPEVISDERDSAGRTHYDRVREFYRTHDINDYDVTLYYDRANDRLTDLFYKGDRSMRESGFDPSNRFGPFSADIIHYAPVCLNSLLYQMEVDAAEINAILGRDPDSEVWRGRARARQERVNTLLWDEAAGLYFDYSFRIGRRRSYEFATTFYPLWVGLATGEQARRVRENLPKFEAPGGLLTSTQVTGSQWDAPFGWAPLQMIAVDGLRRYGYEEDADRLSAKFVSLVAKEFQEHHTIVEKYDVRRRESDVSAGITFGYSSNEIGFGWTNAVVLELLAGMREPVKRQPDSGVQEPAITRHP